MDRNIVQEPLERVALAIANTHTPNQQILVASQEHWLNAARAAIAAMDVRELCEALERNASALNSFIYIIAHRFDGDGTYYWMRDPTHDEAQAALAVNNNAAEVLAKAGFNEGGS